MRKLAMTMMIIGGAATAGGLTLAWIGYQGQVDAEVRWHQQQQNPAAAVESVTSSTSSSLAKLSFPSLHREFIVTEGATERNLLLGPVHVERSVEPGQNGNCIIAAHRDTHFRILREIQKGDEILIESAGKVYRYRTVSLAIVSADDVRFYHNEDRALLTLVTCYPFYYVGPAPKRFIVRARLV